MGEFKWVRVSKGSPCPVCQAPDWCCVSQDRAVARCMRQPAGCFKSGEDKGGNRYHLHRLAAPPGQDRPPPNPGGAGPKRADADTLHEVYSALLAVLRLSGPHREALRKRGLFDEAIDRSGYKSLPVQGRSRLAQGLRERFGDRLLRAPGFVVKEGERGRYVTLRGPAGLVVPCRDPAGRVVALKVRRDGAGDGPRYVYVSSAGHGGPGPGAPAHAPLGTPATAEVVRLTEGELKADIVFALGEVPALSAPGAGSWRYCLPALKGLGARTVRLAFDMDAWDNPRVARPLPECARALADAGYAVELERWDAGDGKGLDDLLAAGKAPQLLQGEAVTEALREILASASGGEGAAPDELGRLWDVLDQGGAEALFRDKELLHALADLAAEDPAAFLAVRASVRGCVPVRDFDGALKPFRRAAPAATTGPGGPYFEEGGCTCRNVPTKEGPVAVVLCNFTARIVEEVCHDDGAEQSRSLAVEGELAGGGPLPRAEVPAAEFAGMNWVVPAWGTRAVVAAGMGTRDHLRAALQTLSGDVPRRTVYGHTGWRELDGRWAYLHAGARSGLKGRSGRRSRCPRRWPGSACRSRRRGRNCGRRSAPAWGCSTSAR